MQRLQKLAPDQLAPAMKMLFGDESIGPAAQIVKSVDGLVAAFAMADDRAKTLGSLQAEFDSMGNTTQQQMHKAREGVKVVTTALGVGLLPAINTTLAAFAPMALGLAQWMQANEGMVTTVVSIIAAIMAFKIAAIAGAYAFTFLKGAWLAGKAVLFALRTAWMLHTGALVAGTAVSRTAMVVSKGLIAVNLNEFVEMASNHRQQVPPMSELKKVLRTSKTRRFVDASRAVNSALTNNHDKPDQGKTVRCWIFERNS